MFNVLKAMKGKCPLCPKGKDQQLFVVKGEIYNGRICAEHLFGLASETDADQEEREREALPVNGQVRQ
jgi:asparagine synthetase B (glutamine-hydrolysing)